MVAGYTTAVASTVQRENPPVLQGEASYSVQAVENTGQAVLSKTELQQAERPIQGLLRLPILFHLTISLIAHTSYIFSVLTEVQACLEKRKEDDQKLLAKKAGHFRLRAHNVWHKGDDEDKLKEWREKIKIATEHFHVRTIRFQLTGN
jgi:hypothetical protein